MLAQLSSCDGYLTIVLDGSSFGGPYDYKVAGPNFSFDEQAYPLGNKCGLAIYATGEANEIHGSPKDDKIYGYGGDGTMQSDMNPIRQMIEREGQVPEECDYRILIVAKPTADEVSGWDDLESYDVGETRPKRLGYLLWAGDTAVDYSYWKKR